VTVFVCCSSLCVTYLWKTLESMWIADFPFFENDIITVHVYETDVFLFIFVCHICMEFFEKM